jgi:hypothetical protein
MKTVLINNIAVLGKGSGKGFAFNEHAVSVLRIKPAAGFSAGCFDILSRFLVPDKAADIQIRLFTSSSLSAPQVCTHRLD